MCGLQEPPRPYCKDFGGIGMSEIQFAGILIALLGMTDILLLCMVRGCEENINELFEHIERLEAKK